MLDALIRTFASLNQQPYLQKLYRVIYTAAYFGLLRIGEVAKGEHVILVKNVHIGINKHKILLILETSKTHGQGDKPQQVKITSKGIDRLRTAKDNVKYCPFTILNEYI